MGEGSAVQDLGNVEMIASQILASQPIKEKKLSNPVKGLIVALLILGSPLWACIGLALLALIFTGVLLILTAYILIWMIPVLALVFMVAGLIVCCVSIVGSPFVMSSNFYDRLVTIGHWISRCWFFNIGRTLYGHGIAFLCTDDRWF